MTDTEKRLAEIRERCEAAKREKLVSEIDRLTAELSEARTDCDITDAANVALHGALQAAENENAELLQKTQQLEQENAWLTERLKAVVEDLKFVFEQKRRYADSKVLDGVDCICPLCACWLGDGAKSCDGDCNNAQWRGEGSE